LVNSYPSWLRLDIMLRTVIYEGVIKAEEPLRIGVGREEDPWGISDLPVIRIKDISKGIETPYIPGSSLKGVLRSTAEAIAKQYNIKPEPCSGLTQDSCMRRNIQELGSNLEDLVKQNIKENEDKALQQINKYACLLCKVFGATSYRSKVYLNDAYPFDASGRPLPVAVEVKRGIAIDRTTGAAAPGALYNVEYVSPGSMFFFKIIAYNLPNYALALLLNSIKALDNGYVRLGGFKSRGFGKATINQKRITIIHSSQISYVTNSLPALDDRDSEVSIPNPRVEDGKITLDENGVDELTKRLWEEAWIKYAKGGD